MNYILLLLNIILLVSGQLLWKTGVSTIDNWSLKTFVLIAKSPYIMSGLLLYGIATIIWLYVISKIPFSIAYPFQSLSYAMGVVVAYFIFKENIDLSQWIGVLVIIVGVYLIAK
jgi:drug/metabolite transporter (DMT)-like permease